MEQLARPLRSVLYIPASKARILEKATQLPADAIIFDLEDAVTPEAKVEARKALAHALDIHDYGTRYKIIRINGLDTEWGRRGCATGCAVWCRCGAFAQGEHAR